MKTARKSAKRNAKRVHVISRKDQWAVKKEGTTRASRIYANKQAAVKGAKKIASNDWDVIVHRKDGSIDKWSKPEK